MNLPRACKDVALSKMASKSRLTACIDIGGVASLSEFRLGSSPLLAMDSFNLGTTAAISIPSNT